MLRVRTVQRVLYTNIDLKLQNKSQWTNVLQNRCYMCLQWTRVLYSVVITRQSNPLISQFNSSCNEFTLSVWSMCLYNNSSQRLFLLWIVYTQYCSVFTSVCHQYIYVYLLESHTWTQIYM